VLEDKCSGDYFMTKNVRDAMSVITRMFSYRYQVKHI